MDFIVFVVIAIDWNIAGGEKLIRAKSEAKVSAEGNDIPMNRALANSNRNMELRCNKNWQSYMNKATSAPDAEHLTLVLVLGTSTMTISASRCVEFYAEGATLHLGTLATVE